MFFNVHTHEKSGSHGRFRDVTISFHYLCKLRVHMYTVGSPESRLLGRGSVAPLELTY